MNVELAFWRWMAALLAFGQMGYAAQADNMVGMFAPMPVLAWAVASGIAWLATTLRRGMNGQAR